MELEPEPHQAKSQLYQACLPSLQQNLRRFV
jgi:hypothetical protein